MRWELQKMFFSPIAWLVLIAFAIQSGMAFFDVLDRFIWYRHLNAFEEEVTFNFLSNRLLGGFFPSFEQTIYLYIPLITMGMMSKEFSSGSIKLLYSSPISNTQIVWGKYLAALVFCAILIAILLLEHLYGFFAIKEYDFVQSLTGLLGLFLILAAYSAIGLFMSSLTSYQIVAAICSFATFFILQNIRNIGQTIDLVKDITYWLSVSGRGQSFFQGLIATDDFLYFFLISGLFITFTLFRLRDIREKSARMVSIGRYSGALLLAVVIGYVSTSPTLRAYLDTTRTQLNTLTQKSQQVMAQLEGRVKITTYVNLLNRFAGLGTPTMQNRDTDRYEKYMRFYPYIDLEYQYYYDMPVQEDRVKYYKDRFAGKSQQEALEYVSDLYRIDSDGAKPGKEFAAEIDLKNHLNRFVTKLETEEGREAYLHIFDDPAIFPFEEQMTAAFKRLAIDLPQVGFVTGHQERGLDNIGPRGFQVVAKEKPYRWSMLNNGMDFYPIDLSNPVDNTIEVLVIAEPKTAFNDRELQHLNQYIDRGGNLIMAADIGRQEVMNPLVEQLGITFLPGQVVEFNKGYPMDFITAIVTEPARKLAFQWDEEIAAKEGCVPMPGVVALDYQPIPGFTYTPLLISDPIQNLPKATDTDELEKLKADYATEEKKLSPEEIEKLKYSKAPITQDSIDQGKYKGSWNELQTANFIDEIATYDPDIGEQAGTITTALALTRSVNGKEQRIIVLGDADCFSNGELAAQRQRRGMDSKTSDFINGMFFWLTYEESPTDGRRPPTPDDEFIVSKDKAQRASYFYSIGNPILLVAAFLFIWLRRRSR